MVVSMVVVMVMVMVMPMSMSMSMRMGMVMVVIRVVIVIVIVADFRLAATAHLAHDSAYLQFPHAHLRAIDELQLVAAAARARIAARGDRV